MKNNAGTWPLSRLKDVIIDMQPGFAQRPNVENIGTSQLRTNNISPQGSLDLSDIVNVKVTPSELEKYGVRQGDVIFNNTNSVEWVGKTAYFDREGDYVLSNHMTRIRPNPSLLDAEFLARYLHYLWQTRISAHRAKQWVNQAAIDQAMLAQFEIPLPPLPEQRRIVAILHQADKLRQLRREADEKAQQLLPALFYEMFGDPATNPRRWDVTTLETVCDRITDGTHQPPPFTETGIPFLFVSDIVDGKINLNTSKYISQQTYETLMRRCPVERGDILYSIVGSYGVAVVVQTDQPFAFQRHIAHIKPKRALVDPLFLCSMLNSTYVKSQADQRVRGIAQGTLNLGEIAQFRIYVPSISLQQTFAERVRTVQEVKADQTLTSQHLENVFQSLLIQAFSGELTAAWREQHKDEDEAVRITTYSFEERLEAASALHVVSVATFEDQLEVS